MISEKDIRRCVDFVGQTPLWGWDASQKHNGCFAWWDGVKTGEFYTREGNFILAPKWFKEGLPPTALTGEIHAGIGEGFGNDNSAYKIAMTAVRHGGNWFEKGKRLIRFEVFDAPKIEGNWYDRICAAGTIMGRMEYAAPVQSERIQDSKHLAEFMIRLHAMKAEGAVFNNPDEINYIAGKTGAQLRWKFKND